MGVPARLLLEYDAGLVPEGGSAVLCPLGAPIQGRQKEAAGWIFHDFALRQAGLLSEWRRASAPRSPQANGLRVATPNTQAAPWRAAIALGRT